MSGKLDLPGRESDPAGTERGVLLPDGGERKRTDAWPSAFEGWSAAAKPSDRDVAYTRTYEWQFRGQTYEEEFSLPVSVYEYCTNRHRVHDYGVYITDPLQKPFVETLRERFRTFADRHGLDDRELLTAVIRFVQSLPYTLDMDDTGHLAYPKYAIETLVHGCGDCEDGAILLGTVLHALGYDVAPVVFPDAQHMVLGVACDRDEGACVERDGTRYYLIETTDFGWDIGDLPPEYRDAAAQVQLPDEFPVLVHQWNATPAADGAVDVTAHVANYGEADADPLDVQMEFESRDHDVVARCRLNDPGESLAPGESARYDCRLRLPFDRTLQGYLVLGVEQRIHDRSESEWR